jgi:hypothetical protein
MTELNEPVGVAVPPDTSDPDGKKEPCKRIYLHAFRGDRSQAFLDDFNRKVADNRAGTGPGPTFDECLLWSGHVGISFEAESPIYGFNPDGGSEPIFTVLDKLKGKKSYPGHVTDDSKVFGDAKSRGLSVLKIEYIYPESRYNEIKKNFDAEKSSCTWHYSFPGGSGGCNCATFPQRIGIKVPEGSGNMKLYMQAMQAEPTPQRMGDCTG